MRKGFRATSRVFDREPALSVAAQIMASENAKTHGKSMVVIGLDGLTGAQWLRMDFERVFCFDDVLSQLNEFVSHAGDAIRFLFSSVRKTADARRAFEQRRDRGERKKGVGELVEVLSDSLAAMTRDER